MRFAFVTAVAVLLAGTGLSAPAGADLQERFSGAESGRTPVFETSGPWLLYWSVSSDFPEMASFELRVFDAESDEFLGTVQNEGTGGGRRLFERAGRYELQIISEAVRWEIEISAADATRAAELKRSSEGRATLDDAASREARRVPADAFVSWRPVDDSTLLLFANDEATGFRVHFSAPCPGLSNATALSFIALPGGPERYDSILLEDGTRCYFARVVPTVFD